MAKHPLCAEPPPPPNVDTPPSWTNPALLANNPPFGDKKNLKHPSRFIQEKNLQGGGAVPYHRVMDHTHA